MRRVPRSCVCGLECPASATSSSPRRSAGATSAPTYRLRGTNWRNVCCSSAPRGARAYISSANPPKAPTPSKTPKSAVNSCAEPERSSPPNTRKPPRKWPNWWRACGGCSKPPPDLNNSPVTALTAWPNRHDRGWVNMELYSNPCAPGSDASQPIRDPHVEHRHQDPADQLQARV